MKAPWLNHGQPTRLVQVPSLIVENRYKVSLLTWDSFVQTGVQWLHNGKFQSLQICITSGSGTTSLAWTYMEVCGYSDSFCKNLNQRSLAPRWPLTPHLLRSYEWLYPRIIVSKSPKNTSKYVDTVTFFAKTWTKGHWPLGDLWPHICWGHMCDYPRIILSKSHENTLKYVDTVTLFAKTWTKGQWPLDDLWPHICWGLMCVTLPKDHCFQVPWKYIKVCGYSDLFAKKNLNQRSLTPRWPLTPHLLRSHVWLYPRIIVSKSHENTSKYVDTVNLFAKTWTTPSTPNFDSLPYPYPKVG